MNRAQTVKNWIKKSKSFGLIYYYAGLFIVTVLKNIIRPNDKQILFISYSGRQYSDTPKEAYLQLKNDPNFKDFKMIWAFNRPVDFNDSELEYKVNANSPLFFFYLLRSKYWIANSSIDRLIPFKHSKHVYIQFWHGIPMKTLGPQEKGLAPLVRNWYNKVSFDYLFVYGDYDAGKLIEVFPKTKKIINKGQLRKKSYERQSDKNVDSIKSDLGIDVNKPVLLYVPTWRGYESTQQTKLSSSFLKELSQDYNVLYRGHYFSGTKLNSEVISVDNFSLYKLFRVADIMVTDYSSVFFDFSELLKPIYLFQPDIDEYREKRGLYLSNEDIQLPVAYSEDELRRLLKNKEYPIEQVGVIRDNYNPHDSNEAVVALKNILEVERLRN